MFENFEIGKAKLAKGECTSTREQKETIERLMLVPLIQGTLRYAYKTDKEPFSEKAEAEGTVFAHAVVPAVYDCDAAAGNLIAENMKAGQAGTADFAAVKAAFEGTYECLGISGAEIGGLYDSATEAYYPGAEPSGFVADDGSAAPKIGMAIPAGVAALA